MGRNPLLGRLAAVAASVALCCACASCGSCARAAPSPGTCADLVFRGHDYNEWRPVKAPGALGFQELGDAGYPACNEAAQCGGDQLAGFGGTDARLLKGVDPSQAVVGLREGTDHTFVIFVRVGVDPATLRPAP